MSVADALARLWPFPVDPDTELDRAVRYLDTDVAPERLVRIGRGGAVLAVVLGAVAALGGARGPAIAVLFVAVAAEWAGSRGPIALATLRRTTALGAAPGVIGRAVLHMRVTPSPERAAEFAADADGPLARSLREHVRRSAGTPQSALSSFAGEWADWFPALRRAALLLDAAADVPAARRDRALDRATSAVLDGTRDRMAAFVSDVRGPATGLYAFAVLLPLALVGVLPAARIAGIPVTIGTIALLYNVVLPVGLLCAGGWLLARRPVAFPPTAVPRSHPDVPDRRWPAVAVGLAAGCGTALAASTVVRWTAPIALVGIGTGVALVGLYRPVHEVRRHVRAIERDLPDALYLVGRRVGDRIAVETAIGRAADDLDGPAGELLADAAGVQRRLGVGVREAFLGEYGALTDVPSVRTRTAMELLPVAAREGAPAGRTIVAMADHVEELQSVERSAREQLANVTDTLRNTASLFGPLVAGATVALADGVASTGNGLAGAPGGEPLPTAELGLAVGSYVLLMAAILTAIAVALERGLDRALIGYRVGVALVVATLTFLVAVVAAGTLL